MEFYNDILLTINRQNMVSRISSLGQQLLTINQGAYFPVVFRHEHQIQSISVPQKNSKRSLECWLAPLKNPEGNLDGFTLIRQPSSIHDQSLQKSIRSTAQFSVEDFKNALVSNEFFLVFQPEKRTRDQQTRVAEALLRWRRSNGIIYNAQDFLPDAERLGLSQEIGAWVISAVCQQNRLWQMRGLRPISISVNLSPEQLINDQIVQHVGQHLENCGLPPHYLQFEVNSRCLHGNGSKDIEILHRLKSLGVRLMLDDLRMHDTSWQQLLLWPVDAVKIARPQWNDTLAAVARGLGKVLIVRGIESANFSNQTSADVLQGYAICQPLEPNQMAHRLDRNIWAA